MNEDFSLPWFVAHLYFLARAARVRTPLSILLASLPLGLALSTWHATGFFVALEAFAIFAWFAGFSLIGVSMLYLLYRDWKKLGGDEAYLPPAVEEIPTMMEAKEMTIVRV